MKTILSCYYARTHKRQFLGSNCSEKWMGTTHHCQSHLRMSLTRKRNHSFQFNHRTQDTNEVPRLGRQLHGAALGTSGRAVVC